MLLLMGDFLILHATVSTALVTLPAPLPATMDLKEEERHTYGVWAMDNGMAYPQSVTVCSFAVHPVDSAFNVKLSLYLLSFSSFSFSIIFNAADCYI